MRNTTISHHSHFAFPVWVFQIPVRCLPAHCFCLMRIIMIIIWTMMMFMMMNVIRSLMMMMIMMREGRALPETHSGASFMRQCSSGIKNPIHIHQHDRHDHNDDDVDFLYIVIIIHPLSLVWRLLFLTCI